MAGSNSGFDRAGFEAGIRFAMQMGAPLAESDQAKFHFPKTGTATVRSADDVPFDPAVAHDRVGKPPVSVPCAVEFGQPADQATNFGPQRPTRLKVTLLESDYRQVEDCEFVVYGGDRYEYRAAEPGGLFDAGVWVMHFVREAA